MRHTLTRATLLITPLLCSASMGPAPEQDAAADRAAIEEVALDYVEGYYEGDADRVARSTHPSLQRVVVRSIPEGREFLGFMDQAPDLASGGK